MPIDSLTAGPSPSGLTEVPQVEVEDIILPQLTLPPPPGIKVTSYSAVFRHLEQSKFISAAFQSKFSMTYFSILLIDDR